jgi:hypothetical protein
LLVKNPIQNRETSVISNISLFILPVDKRLTKAINTIIYCFDNLVDNPEYSQVYILPHMFLMLHHYILVHREELDHR